MSSLNQQVLARLQQFARGAEAGVARAAEPGTGSGAEPRAQETCDLCKAGLGSSHDHLLDPTSRKLFCSCRACALLFDAPGAQYRRVPRDVHRLTDDPFSDAAWAALRLPIDLVFFLRDSRVDRIVAVYPSPAGPTESQVHLPDHPVLSSLLPDVEALLVDRRAERRDCYRAPIDECYKLVGLLRRGWRGLSGGPDVWRDVDAFFTSLRERARHA